MNKRLKIIIGIIVSIIILWLIIFLIDYTRVSHYKEPIFVMQGENYQKYSKTVDNTKIELNIPNEWKYEEVRKKRRK